MTISVSDMPKEVLNTLYAIPMTGIISCILIIEMVKEIVNPEMLTTKGDKKMHGRGIHSVRKISEKYGGTLVLKDQGTEFETNLILTDIQIPA